MITTKMITRSSDGDDNGDVRQEVMQKDGQSESEREHDGGGGHDLSVWSVKQRQFFCYCISQRSKRRNYL